MDSFVIIVLILLCSLALLVTIFVFVVYSGLFSEIKVGVGTPPIKSATILYKFGKGSYKNTGGVFTEVTSIAPKMKSFGIYYDDPEQVGNVMGLIIIQKIIKIPPKENTKCIQCMSFMGIL